MSADAQGFHLSWLQRRLALRDPHGRLSAQCVVRLPDGLTEDAARAALARVQERHESLRTDFIRRLGLKVPIQTIAERGEVAWERLETPPAGEDVETLAAALMAGQRTRPFDLAAGPKLRATWCKAPRSTGTLLALSVPALCGDAASLAVLCRELVTLANGGQPEEAEPIQFVDVAAWQSEELAANDEQARSAHAFWARQRGDGPRPLAWPSTAGAEPPRSDTVEAVPVSLDPAATERLADLASDPALSLRSLLLASFGLLLGRLTGEGELAVAVRLEGRSIDELAHGIGPFAHDQPLRFGLPPSMTARALAERIEEQWRQAILYQDRCGTEDGAEGGVKDSWPAAFERVSWSPAAADLGLGIVAQRALLAPFVVKLSTLERGPGEWSLTLLHDPAAIDADAAHSLATRLARVVAAVAAGPDEALGAIDLLSTEERRWQLALLGDPVSTTAPAESIDAAIRDQAARTPDAPAVVCGDQTLTYRQLVRHAGVLAAALRRAGVDRETLVGLTLDRSVAWPVAMLAVLEAGGAYLALDPELPAERLTAQLAAARPRVVIGEDALLDTLLAGAGSVGRIRRSALDELMRDEGAPPAIAGERSDADLAYVLFTSGSTGQPKGVMVEHRQLMHYVAGVVERLELPAGCHFATVSTFAADLGHTALFPTLVTGGCVHIMARDLAADPDGFAAYCQAQQLDALKIVPSHLEALLSASQPAAVLPRKRLVLGGEALPAPLAERLSGMLGDSARLYNHYGPTETTVGVLVHPFDADDLDATHDAAAVPLGRPLAGVRVLVTDPEMRLLPLGVRGELMIGGTSLARGYLGAPALTAERFVPDSLSGVSGARLYRTGDGARFTADGDLIFLGRNDHQVKLRGYRIELGEVEAELGRLAAVREAVAVVRQEASGHHRLVAYVSLRPGREAEPSELRQALRRRLPDYMVPAALVVLERLPLSANGKIDRGQLPDPDTAAGLARRPFVAPTTDRERTLADVWCDVLKIGRVGIDDNFFELGGDSIMAIQVIARANQAGLALAPNLMFRFQTIAELLSADQQALPVADQRPVVGEAPLTPIQHWFFEQGLTHRHHFNQSVFLEAGEPTDLSALGQSLAWLLVHHDALRLRFIAGEDGGRQTFSEPPATAPLSVIDHSALPEAKWGRVLEHALGQAQTSLDLEAGRLLRAVVFRRGKDRTERLLLAAHHLAVDAVSWRILLEDLETAYAASRAGSTVRLPAKTTSYAVWAERLRDHAAGGGGRDERGVWLGQPAAVAPLPADRPSGSNTIGDSTVLHGILHHERTGRLQRAATSLRARMDEMLLAALVLTLGRWSGRPTLTVQLEGHGREPLFDDVDLSRTVGWFTAHYPVCFACPDGADALSVLSGVQDALRAVPHHGIHHGVLRYLSPDAEVRAALAEHDAPRVQLNYLGRFDQGEKAETRFRLARENPGPMRHRAGERDHDLGLGASIVDGQLETRWAFSHERFDLGTIEALQARFDRHLEALASAADTAEPADRSADTATEAGDAFPLAGLDVEQLRQLEDVLDDVDRQSATVAAGEPDRVG